MNPIAAPAESIQYLSISVLWFRMGSEDGERGRELGEGKEDELPTSWVMPVAKALLK